MKLPTHEMGEIELLAIRVREDLWESEWEPVRGTIFGDQFSHASQETLNHALYGLSRPLVDALSVPPAGALRKVQKPSKECYRRRKCPIYIPAWCFVTSPKMPWCFEPESLGDEVQRKVATKAIEYWRQGVYLVVIQ
jgi:hypothetical protein